MQQINLSGNTITERATKSFRIYLKEIRQYEPLKSDEEVLLFEQMKTGSKKAKAKLARHNLRFVVSVAKKYYRHTLTEKYYDLSDLVSAGNEGLLFALERHDSTKGFKFISYAVKCIQGTILNFLSNHDFVRIPINRNKDVRNVYRYMNEQWTLAQRDIDFNLAAYEMNFFREEDVLKADYFKNYQNQVRLETEKPDYQNDYDNLFSKSNDEELDNRYVDYIAHPDEKSQPDYQLVTASNIINIERAMTTLTGRETEVIGMYHGIAGPELTLEEIGLRLGITRERVRQIKEKGIRRLRLASRSGIILFGGVQHPEYRTHIEAFFERSPNDPVKWGFNRAEKKIFVGLLNPKLHPSLFVITHVKSVNIKDNVIKHIYVNVRELSGNNVLTNCSLTPNQMRYVIHAKLSEMPIIEIF